MSKKRGRDDEDGEAAPRRQAERAARSTKNRVVSVQKQEEDRLNHLMNLERDNYMDADEKDETNKQGGVVDESSDEDSEGRPKKRARINSTNTIANRNKFPLRKGKATRETAKNFAQILEIEDFKQFPLHVPTYFTIAARASSRPSRKFSKMSGHLAPYTDPETGTRFASVREYESLKEKAQ